MTLPTFGRYEIQAEIGRGGMATVYHAYDPRFKRDVALKVLPREFMHDETFRARFEREAQTIAALEHSAIVPVYDFGEESGQPYLVMRYMAGGSLSDRIMQGYLPLDDVATIIARIASALDSAHRREVIHRDVKPANVLFDQEGDAFLTDFGIVKLTEATAKLTGSGIVGTPAYIAPEMSKPGGVSPLIDVYALGVTLYQVLTRQLPYEADTPIGMLMAHAVEPIPDVLEARPDLPEAMHAVMTKVLAKEPTDRYQAAGELSDDLRRAILGEPISAPITPPAVPTPPDVITMDEGVTLPAEPVSYPAQPLEAPVIEAERRRGMPGWVWGAIAGVGVLVIVGIGAALLLSGVIPTGPEPTEEPMLFVEAVEEAPEAAREGAAEQADVAVGEAEEEAAAAMVAEPAAAEAAREVFTVGMVSDIGGMDDTAFNQGTWGGLERFREDYGDAVEVSFLEALQEADYGEMLQQYVERDADLIISVGFLMAESTAAAAEANPDVHFAIVDVPAMADNVMGIEFAVDEAAFLAGYLAAGMTETGVVGTYGGNPIPTVLRYMVGFEQGVNHYNSVNGTGVQVLGWNTETSEGIFTYDFGSIESGRMMTSELIANRADIIFPAAGPAGLGTIQVVQETPGVMVIWVDNDGCMEIPDACNVILTTVEKRVGIAVYYTAVEAYNGGFVGGTNHIGRLANGSVGLAPLHEFEDDVPDSLIEDLNMLRQGIIDGSINTGWDDFVASGGLDQ